MSDAYAVPPPPPAPAPAARPVTVTVADALLLLVAVLYVIAFIATLAIVGPMRDVLSEEVAGTAAEGSEGFVTAGLIGSAILNLLFAAGFVALALLNDKGKNPARIVTWVVGGIALCCNGVNLAFSRIDTTGGDVDAARLEQRLQEELPGWTEPVSIVATVVSLPALVAAIILLALPASNEFFRRPPPDLELPPTYPTVS